jgi:ribosomal protein S18 acetylase RimI-like enzyme
MQHFEGECVIVPAEKKHLYTLNLLTKKYFPYANFSYSEVTRRMADPNIVYLVAQDKQGGSTMGFVDYEVKPQRLSAQILGLAVLEEYREKGVGTKLLEKALSKIISYRNAEGLPLKYVELLVSVENTAALSLYAKYGFVKAGILDRTLHGQQVLVYSKKINEPKEGQVDGVI